MTKINILFLIVLVTSFAFVNCHSTKTADAGNIQEKVNQWKLLTQTPVKATVSIPIELVFFDENNGIATQMSAIEKTTDGGRTWSTLYEFDKRAVHSLVLTKDKVVWVVGHEYNSDKKNAPFIQSSRDRGASWQEVVIDKNDAESISNGYTVFYGICFTSPQKAWITGDKGILETSIAGQNLKITDQLSTEAEVFSISCGENGEVWATGREGLVYNFQNGWNIKQTDKSYHYSEVKSVANDVWLMGYKRMSNSDEISGIVLRSRDKGISWEDKTPEKIRSFSDVYLQSNQGWLVGSDGNIYYSTDDGDSWRKFDSPTTNSLEHIFALDEKNIWIGGVYHTVLKYRAN